MAGRHPVWSLLLRASALPCFLPSFGPCQSLYCKRSACAGCPRSLSSFVASPLRSSYSRPSTLDHAAAPSGRLPPIRDQSLPASAAPVPARFVSGSWTPSATHTACEKVVFFKNRLKLGDRKMFTRPEKMGSKLWRRPPAYNANAGRSDYDTLGTGHRLRGLPAARTR
jgi:hypothetical protein